MLAEYPELSIRPLKTNAGFERLLRPIQLAPQTEETYLEFSKFGQSTGRDFSQQTLRAMNLPFPPQQFQRTTPTFLILAEQLHAERRLPSNRKSILN